MVVQASTDGSEIMNYQTFLKMVARDVTPEDPEKIIDAFKVQSVDLIDPLCLHLCLCLVT